jgi:4a-hydroxytetrahydrobiopterin dehydratase
MNGVLAMIDTATLLEKKCRPLESALSDAAIAEHRTAVPEWALQNGKIARSFSFKNYYETMAFVNAIAYLSHAEDHHPELAVTYNRCTVKYDTHSVNGGRGGISENDFICAAKVDALAQQGAK